MLRTSGDTPVVVSLVAPLAATDSSSPEAYRAAIAQLQDEVIAAIDTADFRVRVRFSSVAALAGVVRTERGLRQLLAHRHVQQVSLDEGGTGLPGSSPGRRVPP